MVDEVELKQVFLKVLWFLPDSHHSTIAAYSSTATP
jgi:hypothetical protein